MLDVTLSTVLLVAVVVGLFWMAGRDFEEEHPDYVDYRTNGKVTFVQQMRAGAFVLFDRASDFSFPGSRRFAVAYKRRRPEPGNVSATTSTTAVAEKR